MPDLGGSPRSAGKAWVKAELFGQREAVSDVADLARRYTGRVEDDLPGRRVGCCEKRLQGRDERSPVADPGA